MFDVNLLILGANGKIAQIMEQRILSEPTFEDVQLTLFLRERSRLNHLEGNSRVTLTEGDLSDESAVRKVMTDQDIVFIATVDIDPSNTITKNVIQAMQAQQVKRVLAASSIGIYEEEPNSQFHDWNQRSLDSALEPMRQAAELLQTSGLTYTILRFAWLNDRSAINYEISKKGEKFAGGSGSRQSMADVTLKIIANPLLYTNEVIGIADPSTKDAPSVVY